MKTTGLIARLCLILLTVTSPVGAAAQPPLQQRVEAALAEAPRGTRFGLVVTDESGRELVAINPDGRFVPASNTKLLTTAAAYTSLRGLDQPDASGGAEVRLQGSGAETDVILTGHGDARLSSAADCRVNCLSALADAVAARTRQVRDVIGDADRFADDRWSPGMSWNNIQTRSGTAVAALVVDDNELTLRVIPVPARNRPEVETNGYYTVGNHVTTVLGNAPADIGFSRLPGSGTVLLTGGIGEGAAPATLRLAVDDPANYAAWQLRRLLEQRGVRVAGEVRSRYNSDRSVRLPLVSEPLFRLTPPPLAEDIVRINKESQNLHAELLLRRIGAVRNRPSITSGVEEVATMMGLAGARRDGWDLSDGSGMSTYNRISPRAMIALLRWAATQSWGAAWRNSFPIAGVDGTLANRFRGTALEGRLFAKTGTINAANALSGYMIGASGRTLTFAFFANDMPGGASATARMDAVLLEIATAN